MRRPLLMCGIMFVLGELTYRLAEESIWLSALTILVGTIIAYVCAKSTKKKSNVLLLFYEDLHNKERNEYGILMD